MGDCRGWLEQRLRGADIILCDTIREEAKAAGFSRKELKEARAALGVKTCNDWACQENGAQNWFWYLED